MDAYEQANKKLNELCGVEKTETKNTFKNIKAMNNREKQMYEYLLQQYGQNYFTKEDVKNMSFCDNGTVWIGNVEFHTPYKLD